MKPGEIPVWKPGNLVQVRKGVFGADEIGIVLGSDPEGRGWLLNILFADGIKMVHHANLQKLEAIHEAR